jgi:hypothetical protein
MKRLMTWGLGLALAFGVSGGIRAAEKDAAIGGYCPVAYVKMGKAVKGDARWSSERSRGRSARRRRPRSASSTSARAPAAWLADLAPLGTDWRKPFLETAPYLPFPERSGPQGSSDSWRSG